MQRHKNVIKEWLWSLCTFLDTEKNHGDLEMKLSDVLYQRISAKVVKEPWINSTIVMNLEGQTSYIKFISNILYIIKNVTLTDLFYQTLYLINPAAVTNLGSDPFLRRSKRVYETTRNSKASHEWLNAGHRLSTMQLVVLRIPWNVCLWSRNLKSPALNCDHGILPNVWHTTGIILPEIKVVYGTVGIAANQSEAQA